MTRDDPRLRAYEARQGRSLGRSFEHYLAAALRPRKSWEEVRDFLAGCLYARDDVEHRRRDVWLHPEDFEASLRGDCEDHALWAWVQLSRLGWDVRFTVGIFEKAGHAWLTVFRGGGIWLLEATEKRPERILFEAPAPCPYAPVWSVDGRLRFFLHASFSSPPPAGRGIMGLNGENQT